MAINDRKLTIVIPTYNRKERLIRQLNSLVYQAAFDQLNLWVIDNHSPYDVVEVIKTEFDEEILSKLKITVRPFNLGLALAISLPFIECKTQWLWILSDDDKVVGDLSVVLDDIEKYDHCSWLKYNISNGRKQDDVEISCIGDFVDYYTDLHPTGDLVFISNTIFNLKQLQEYRQLAVIWQNTVVGHLIPVLQALCDGKAKCKFRDYDLVEYQSAPAGTGYGSLWVTMGLANIGDINFTDDYNTNRRIHEMIQHDIRHNRQIDDIMHYKGRGYRLYCYRRIRSVFYRKGVYNYVMNIIFHLSNISGINFAHFINICKDGFLVFVVRYLRGFAHSIKDRNPKLYFKIARMIN